MLFPLCSMLVCSSSVSSLYPRHREYPQPPPLNRTSTSRTIKMVDILSPLLDPVVQMGGQRKSHANTRRKPAARSSKVHILSFVKQEVMSRGPVPISRMDLPTKADCGRNKLARKKPVTANAGKALTIFSFLF